MLARTPPYQPWTRSSAADEAFAAEVDAIKTDARARRAQLAADRASFWERATSEIQFDYDTARMEHDWWVEGEAW